MLFCEQHATLPFDSRHRRRNGESRSPRRLVILDEPSIVTFVVKWCGSDRSMRGEPRWWNARNCESAVSILRPANWRYPYSSTRLNLKVSVTHDLFLISGNTIYHFIREIILFKINFEKIRSDKTGEIIAFSLNYLNIKNDKVICIIHYVTSQFSF